MSYTSCISAPSGMTIRATGPFLYSLSTPKTKTFRSHQSTLNRELSRAKKSAKSISSRLKLTTTITTKVSLENQATSLMASQSQRGIRPPRTAMQICKATTTQVYIITLLMRTVMKTTEMEIKAGWMIDFLKTI